MQRALALNPSDVPESFRAAFPEYNGRKFNAERADSVTVMNTTWSGGTRSVWRLLEVATGRVKEAAGTQSMFPAIEGQTFPIPEGYIVIEHSRFCGEDMGLTFYVPNDGWAPLLPSGATDVTDQDRCALSLVRGLKSFARKEYWRRQGKPPIWPAGEPGKGPTLPGEYGPDNELVKSLADRGYLKINRAGAIALTIEGRNAAGDGRYDW